MNKNKLTFLGLLLLSLAWLPASAQTKLVEKVEAAPGEAKISYEKYELANGLIVYVHEDHSDPMVHVEVTYKVGSNREHIGITGFAHFFEHMMFQGSKHIADEEHIKIVEGSGGQMNGTTSEDRTNYYETLPSNMLETALWLESDRMGWLLPAVTQKKFEIQRDAVKNEKEQNIVNQPYVLPFVELYRKDFYPKGHPYSWPTIGYVDDLNRVGVQDLKNFFMRWYGPNNAILVIAGDVKTAETMALVEKYFGPIPKGEEVRPMRVAPIVMHQDKFTQYADNVFVPLVNLTYPSVPNYHRDEASLDILASLLGGGRNSIFYQRLVKSKFALQAGVSNPCNELAGEFRFQIAPNPRNVYDLTPGQVQTLVFDSIKAIINDYDVMTQVSDEDLNRVKADFESGFINTLESVQGKAVTLSGWERMAGPSYNLQDDIDRYNKVTKQDLKRVFEKYIKNRGGLCFIIFGAPNADARTKSVNPYPGEVDQEAEAQYKGLTYTEPDSTFDRNIRPTPPPASPAKVPDYMTKNMDNGLRIIHTQNNEIPKVTMVFNISGGQLLESRNPKLLGLASFTAAMMNEGTLEHSSEEIEAALESLGSSIRFNAGGSSTSIIVSSLTKNIDKTLKILEEMLFKPAFKEDDFDRLKEQWEENLRNADKNPGVLARKGFDILNYGQSILAAYGDGYDKTISKIGLDDIKAFYTSYYSPSLTNLTIVANTSLDALMPKLSFLENWQNKTVTMPAMAEFPAKENTVIYLIHKPGATQSRIMFGTRTMPYDYNGDYFKLYLANYSLGGSFNSRININLREEKGFTYGANSYNSAGKYDGTWLVSTSVKYEKTDSAVMEIYKEIKNYYENGMTPEELNSMKHSINQSDALKYETSFEKAGFLANILRNDLPKDFVSQQTALVNSVTLTDLNAVVKKYLNPDQMIIVIVGDERDIKDGLKKLGIAKVTSVDPNKVKIKTMD
ncbi:MAG: insulinase family protein [Bacteroidetes bacterium]|nr:insulinase family protein [Bacteroidota bacterium]